MENYNKLVDHINNSINNNHTNDKKTITPTKLYPESMCIACYNDDCIPDSVLQCGHMINVECLKSYIMSNRCCPMCKTKYTGHRKLSLTKS